jgi:prophage antirepressor-like protein
VPLDKEKLDALLEEIKRLEEKPVKKRRIMKHYSFPKTEISSSPIKKDFLLDTEKKVFFQLSHYYKLVMLSIEDTATAFEIWIKGVLPLLLKRNSLDREEWERINDLGDNDSELEQELIEDWKIFFQHTIQQGLIDREILALINEGKLRVEKMRKES